MSNTVFHNIPPLFDENSKILMLGSMPSPASRKATFFYAHPQNRFWKVLSAILCEPLPRSVEEKKAMLLSHHIALWDVLQSCDIQGAADGTIKNAKPNDFSIIFNTAEIKQVFTLGRTATKYYKKFTGKDSVYLPSTSPAFGAISLDSLITAFSAIKEYL